jgi:lauroyl/myristoyl acyltransferase
MALQRINPLGHRRNNEDESFGSRLQRYCNIFISKAPPPLSQDYNRADYLEFMKEELFRYSPAYARGRVLMHGQKNLFKALENSSVILGLLHHGSWILIGGVLRYVLGVPYTVVASRRNFAVMPQEEIRYWQKAHEFISRYYGAPLFFNDQSPIHLFRWLNRKSTVVGVAFDVRESGEAHKESEILFSGRRIWVQTSQAKLARLTKSVIIPAGIHYLPECKMHALEFYPAITPCDFASDVEVTQAVFTSLEKNYMSFENQGFNDLLNMFSIPHALD